MNIIGVYTQGTMRNNIARGCDNDMTHVNYNHLVVLTN